MNTVSIVHSSLIPGVEKESDTEEKSEKDEDELLAVDFDEMLSGKLTYRKNNERE